MTRTTILLVTVTQTLIEYEYIFQQEHDSDHDSDHSGPVTLIVTLRVARMALQRSPQEALPRVLQGCNVVISLFLRAFEIYP